MRQNLAQNPVLRACGGRFGSAGQGMGAGKGVTREGSSSSYEKGFYNKCWGRALEKKLQSFSFMPKEKTVEHKEQNL